MKHEKITATACEAWNAPCCANGGGENNIIEYIDALYLQIKRDLEQYARAKQEEELLNAELRAYARKKHRTA